VTVCDPAGVVLEMNDAAALVFEADGGRALIGRNILDCHPEPARTQLEEMLARREPNVYSIEKRGVKKLIYQVPWHRDGAYAGFLELSLEIPFQMPHVVRTT
jgi:PAS domain-containing protein